jgi:uncharacterized membrane protein YccF (DUF307 family)
VRTIGNVLWVLLGGIGLFLGYLVGALICFVLVITIPFGVACVRLAVFSLWPFGRALVKSPRAGAASLIGNIIWFPFGLAIALGHAVVAALWAITIIGIPFAVAHVKIARCALLPFGREIVPLALADRYEDAVVVRSWRER